jgi:hypothetical protein
MAQAECRSQQLVGSFTHLRALLLLVLLAVLLWLLLLLLVGVVLLGRSQVAPML